MEPPATCEGCTAPLLRSIFIDGEHLNDLSKLACFLFLKEGGRASSAICDGCRGLSLRSPFSPAQPWSRQDAPLSQVAMARRTVRRSVRTKSGTDQVAEPSRDRALRFIHRLSRKAPIHLQPSWRSQVVTRQCGFTHRGAVVSPPHRTSHSGVRVRRAREINSPYAPRFFIALRVSGFWVLMRN